MPVTDRVSHTLKEAWTSAKKAWQEPKVEAVSEVAVGAVPQSTASSYYVDTLSKAGDELPQVGNNTNNDGVSPYKGLVEQRLEKMSAHMDAGLDLEDRDFDKLQSMIYGIIMLMMRLAAKEDLEDIYKISIKVKSQAQEIKATYNTWQGLTVTVISAGVSIAGGCAGLTPFLPLTVITQESSRALSSAAYSIGTAGTGISGIGSIFNNRSEGNRQVLQIYLKRTQDNEEERKGSKHTRHDHLKTAKAAAEEYARSTHEARRAATAA